MAAKTTGAELKRFYSDEEWWPKDDDTYHDDEYIEIDGRPMTFEEEIEKIPDDAKIKLEGGAVYSNRWDAENAPSFEAYFKRWKKAQTTTTLVIECDKSKVEEIATAIKAAGGKVIQK